MHAIDHPLYPPPLLEAWAPCPIDLDACYIAPHYQRQGVATALYTALESLARSHGLPRVWVKASALTRPFFQAQGFTLLGSQQVLRHGQVLVNYRMEKPRLTRNGG